MAFLLWGMAAPLLAQGNGSVTGTATGPQGRPLAGYTVAGQDLRTHYVYKTKTNKKGNYILLGLPMHVYDLTLQDPSGKDLQTVSGQALDNGDRTTVNFDLQHSSGEAGGGAAGMGNVGVSGPPMSSRKVSASKLYSKKVAGIVERAQQEASAGQFAQAAADYQKAIQQAPPDSHLENELGMADAKLNNLDGAVAAFQKAADLDPEHAGQFYFNMGAVQVDHTQMAAAAKSFKKSIEADPKNADAYYWEGQALVASAKTLPGGKVVLLPGTVEAFETYIKLAPNTTDAAVARAILKTIAPGKSNGH